MPHTTTREKQGIYRKFNGIISGDEILDSNFETHKRDDFMQIQYVINDFSDVEGHSVDIVHTQAFASSDKVIANAKIQLKIAIVATQTEMVALAENYIKLMASAPFECQLFDNLTDARQWANTSF